MCIALTCSFTCLYALKLEDDRLNVQARLGTIAGYSGLSRSDKACQCALKKGGNLQPLFRLQEVDRQVPWDHSGQDYQTWSLVRRQGPTAFSADYARPTGRTRQWRATLGYELARRSTAFLFSGLLPSKATHWHFYNVMTYLRYSYRACSCSLLELVL